MRSWKEKGFVTNKGELPEEHGLDFTPLRAQAGLDTRCLSSELVLGAADPLLQITALSFGPAASDSCLVEVKWSGRRGPAGADGVQQPSVHMWLQCRWPPCWQLRFSYQG